MENTKESTEKRDLQIGIFYEQLGRGEKGRFTAWLQLVTAYSMNTVLARLRGGGWSEAERDYIERGIGSGTWQA